MSGCSSDLAKMNELRETHKQWSPVGISEVNFLEPHNQSEAWNTFENPVLGQELQISGYFIQIIHPIVS